MENRTNFFVVLSQGLVEHNVASADDLAAEYAKETSETAVELLPGSLSDEDLRAKLREILSCIKTLSDYEKLIMIFVDMKSVLTLRFLLAVFDILVEVELRVWGNVGYAIPLECIYAAHSDMLLDNWPQFAYNYERDIVRWTKETGVFKSSSGNMFVKARNHIYSEYMAVVQEVLGGSADSIDTSDYTGDAPWHSDCKTE